MLSYYTIYRETSEGRTVLDRKRVACSWDAAIEGYLFEHPEDGLSPADLSAVPYPDPATVEACKQVVIDAVEHEWVRGLSLDSEQDRTELAAWLVGRIALADELRSPHTYGHCGTAASN
jgi:hypothetical protein